MTCHHTYKTFWSMYLHACIFTLNKKPGGISGGADGASVDSAATSGV